MLSDEFKFDDDNILEFPQKDGFIVLQRLAAYTEEFRSRVAETVETYLSREEECIRKCEANDGTIARLQAVKKDIAAKLDDIILDQKVQDKKIATAATEQAKLAEEIREAKARKENISLEIVDLEQGLADCKKKKKDQWNAIKMACFVYKDNLNFHLEYTDCKDHDLAKVTFFQKQNPDRESYFVNLLYYGDLWKVGQIEPALKEIHLEELMTMVDTTKPLDLPNVIVYLCKLRNIFSKHYFHR